MSYIRGDWSMEIGVVVDMIKSHYAHILNSQKINKNLVLRWNILK